jgi:outer membrane protein TolC
MIISIGLLALLMFPGSASASAAAPSLSLEQAIQAARKANAGLPVAALDVQIAGERQREMEAAKRLRLTWEGDFIFAPANGYDPVVTNLGEERLQLAGDKPLYHGGAFGAEVRRAGAQYGAAGARYRQAVREVEYDVRTQYAEILAAEQEIAARQETLRQMESYRSLLESRHQAGQDVSADLSRTAIGVAAVRADLMDAQVRRDGAKLTLNFLMGRPPDTPFDLEALPPTVEPSAGPAAAAETSPDVEAARLETEAAAAALQAARAELKPWFDFHADAGLWGSDTGHAVPPELMATNPHATFADRLQRDLGYSVSVSVSWPLTDFGGMRSRIAQAGLALEQAAKSQKAATMLKDLQSAAARKSMEHAYRQFRELTEAVPKARDAVLEAESRYWGGAGSTLEVLDAFTAATDLAVRRIQAELTYRQADALARRWEGRL